jgi:DNA polymerase III subunit delta'
MSLPFFGNQTARDTLRQMRESGRIPQTILLHGPSGIGKATLVRRFAAELLGHEAIIEQDDLSLPANAELIAEREKLPADKRNEDPLLLASFTDFMTFPPDGPLRQISIEQMRTFKERAQFGPSTGQHRVFLIDQIDRANESAANSLLKILEEPPPYLIVMMTAENSYDLLPTIRSRSVMIPMAPLDKQELRQFIDGRALDKPEQRAALSGGCPGRAVTLDLAQYEKRRSAMLTLLEVASGRVQYGEWIKFAESLQASKSEKLEYYLESMYYLLEDVLLLQNGWPEIKNADVSARLKAVASSTGFAWVRAATAKVDELHRLVRRNIQKGLALDSFALEMMKVRADQ